MNSDDLVMEAIVALKGKWPDELATHIIGARSRNNLTVEQLQIQAVTTKDNKYFYAIDKAGERSWCISVLNSWEIYCTRSQFETRLQELVDAAPEGADIYWAAGVENNSYMKKCPVVECPEYFQDGEWKRSDFPIGDYSDLIPLPPKTPETEASAFVLKVGQECEYPTGQGVIKLPADANGIVIVEEEGVYKRAAQSACRPLKNKNDKERKQLIEVIESCGNLSSGLLADVIISSGWKLSK